MKIIIMLLATLFVCQAFATRTKPCDGPNPPLGCPRPDPCDRPNPPPSCHNPDPCSAPNPPKSCHCHPLNDIGRLLRLEKSSEPLFWEQMKGNPNSSIGGAIKIYVPQELNGVVHIDDSVFDGEITADCIPNDGCRYTFEPSNDQK